MFLLDENLHRMDDDDCSYNASRVAFRDNCSEKGYAETMTDAAIAACTFVVRVGMPVEKEQFLIGQWLASADILTTQYYGIQGIAIYRQTQPCIGPASTI